MISKHIQFNISIILFVFTALPFSGKTQGTEEQAARFFKKGQYLQALPIYEEYSQLYPNTPIYTYYYGVCLTETGNFGNKTRKLLLKVALEDVPVNVLFYIGKNYHAMNDFETALIYYQQFKDVSKSKEQHDVNLRKVMKQCENYQNPFTNEPPDSYLAQYIGDKLADSTSFETNAEETPEKVTISKEPDEIHVPQNIDQHQVIDSTVNVRPEKEETEESESQNTLVNEENIEEILEDIQDTSINFVLTTEIYYSNIKQFRNETAKNHFLKALVNSKKMEQFLKQTEQLRKDYDQTESSDFKKDIANEVIALEKKQLALKTAIEYDFLKAREIEMDFWNDAPPEEFQLLKDENGGKITKPETEQAKASNLAESPPENTDREKLEILDEENTGTLYPENETEPISDESAGAEITYKVQIGAYKSELPETTRILYEKLSVLRKIDQYVNEKGITIYTIGSLSDFENAQKLQEQIRQESIKDAFIVAFKQGKRISLKEALEYTEE
ncbi:MAG: SPOR domain-containing protein [Prolixibacteraceae bacterium]|nr:SPOR domain-containing protein [Prolixibacteraceae bacterium]